MTFETSKQRVYFLNFKFDLVEWVFGRKVIVEINYINRLSIITKQRKSKNLEW